MERALGIDWGVKRIGLALSDGLGLTAQPLETLEHTSQQADLGAIAQRCEENGVSVIVLGLPLNMNGSEGPKAEAARAFASALQKRTGLPVELVDERLTTVQVQRVLVEADVSRKKRRQVIDQMAAQVILQAWLDSRPSRSLEPEEEP